MHVRHGTELLLPVTAGMTEDIIYNEQQVNSLEPTHVKHCQRCIGKQHLMNCGSPITCTGVLDIVCLNLVLNQNTKTLFKTRASVRF